MGSSEPHLYPVFLDLRGARVVVVGGGPVALRKARRLAKSGALVKVVAKKFGTGWQRMTGCRRVVRAFRTSDLAGARLVFAATDDTALNALIAAQARARGCWVNVAAPPAAGTLQVPACVRRGKLCVAISTGGVSCAAARALRRGLEAALAGEWTVYLRLVDGRRRKVLSLIADAQVRRRLLRALGDPVWLKRLRLQGRAAVARQMDALISAARTRTA